ncbi:SusC/RagA family TonB-linked outer membrane protein [Duncaniella muricolitica]|uniref:SusC/RagA family TonB-linked outer membrane protein n=1 Tax=Duncaniella muricolitica TaxID=2880704 RepID=UPI00244E197F|nr:TonB-dependent receptor [Duncaniella muricolitica]
MTRKVWLAALLTLCFSFPALAQKITVSGTVIDPEGEPLIGASVLVKGETLGTATNIDGEYTISVPSDGILVFSYVGYDTQEIPVNGQTTLNVSMKENSLMLDEVVAIGYGTVKKSDATGSVATVKPSEIEAGLATSAQDLLVGASPGVVVTTSGNPSEGGNIQIRGGASLAASNDPLIVIDGVPMDTKGVVGSSNPLSLISPESVESMTILKDASATAIYGSRASNGVIIITTKKGAKGAPQVTFTANAYINTPRKLLNMMSADQFRNFIISEYGAESDQAGALGNYNTDWQKAATRTTFSSDYSLSIGGTAGILPYRVGISYSNNNGILEFTSMERTSANINLSPKFFNDLLSVNANVLGAYVKNSYANNNLGSCASMNPTLPVRDYENGCPLFGYWTSYVGGGLLAGPDTEGTKINSTTAPLNPIADMAAVNSYGKSYQSIGNLQLDLKMPFLTDLRANLNLGYDYQHGTWSGGNYPNTPNAWNGGYEVIKDGKIETIKDGGTSCTDQFQTRVNLLLDFYLNYNHYFESIKSSVDVTAGYSWQKFHNKRREYTYVNRVMDPANEIYLGMQARPTSINIDPLQLVSFFGRANFVFLDKYLVTATVRRDGTSRFSKDHRWGTFPSVALGWKILEENFMEGARGYLNDLKLRAGYGITGQQDLGDDLFPYLPIYSVSEDLAGKYPSLTGKGDGVLPITPGAYNSDIKWEETATWNAGLDFGFMNNRILGSIDFYKRKTKDLLTFANYPAGSNLTNKGNMNIGDLENIGVEFTLTARPIVTKDFTWTSSYNVAWNKNKITRLAEGADTQTGGISAGTGGTIQKHEVGHPAYSFYVYEQVYDKNGNPLEGVFVDRNGDGQINEADKYLYHSRDPKVTMTWNNTFNWKNWDFGFVLRANIGNWMYNNNQAANVSKRANAALPLSNLMADTFLFETSDITTIMSDYFVQNASFLRCDNITLGYTWQNLLNNHLRLRLYGAVQNPFVITKYKGLDPEVFSGIDNGVYPKPTTFSLGVVASF